MNVLVTGGAGFIGSHLVDSLLKNDHVVTTLDNFDPFYNPVSKQENVEPHLRYPCFRLVRTDIRDIDALRSQLSSDYDVIVHLAAKAGVTPSIYEPLVYQQVNVDGTHNLLEFARERGISQFIFASSSSVYGVNSNLPWREEDSCLCPISPYAATKVAGELLGHVYSHLFGIRFIAMRLFTVYGPRQRPDLAIRSFASRILSGESVCLYGDSNSSRDYTYVGDVVNGIMSAISYYDSMYEVINLGNNQPVKLIDLVHKLELTLERKAHIVLQPGRAGDVPQTWADTTKAEKLLGYNPETPLSEGLRLTASWLMSADQKHLLEDSKLDSK